MVCSVFEKKITSFIAGFFFKKKFFFLLFTGILCQLFMKYMHKNDIEHAIETEKKCKEKNVPYGPPMLAACVKLWTLTNNSNEAINDLEKLQNEYPNFKIDEYNIIDLMELLIRENRLEKAFEILSNSSHCDATNRFDLRRNLRHLMFTLRDYVARNNITENVSKQMLTELLRKGFCKRSNVHVVFGSVIKEYLAKKAALSSKLLSVLFEISYGTGNGADSSMDFGVDKDQAAVYLNRIIDISQSLYDAKRVNVTILIALACAGNEQQIRKILMDPTVKFDVRAMEKELQLSKHHGRVDAIATIARSARGLRHSVFNEANLYDLLIVHFERTNDFKSAVQLYDELIRGGNCPVSKKFIRILESLLNKNNQKLPQTLQKADAIN